MMRASKVMQERVLNTPNIKMYWNSETEEVLGENKVEAVRIKNTVRLVKNRLFRSADFLLRLATSPTPIFLKDGWIWMKPDI